MAQTMEPPRKQPSADLVGTFNVVVPIEKVNPKDNVAYEVPRGIYPVYGHFTADGKRIDAAAIIFTAPNPKNGELTDIVQKLPLLEVPGMVQRAEIALETKQDRSLKYPLAMFMGDDVPKKHVQTQAPEQEHRLRIARSA